MSETSCRPSPAYWPASSSHQNHLPEKQHKLQPEKMQQAKLKIPTSWFLNLKTVLSGGVCFAFVWRATSDQCLWSQKKISRTCWILIGQRMRREQLDNSWLVKNMERRLMWMWQDWIGPKDVTTPVVAVRHWSGSVHVLVSSCGHVSSVKQHTGREIRRCQCCLYTGDVKSYTYTP